MSRISIAVIICVTFRALLIAQIPGAIVGAGYFPPPITYAAPGQLITLFVPALDVPDAEASSVPLPRSLSGVTVRARVVSINQIISPLEYPTSLPIFRVYTQRSLCSGQVCPNTQITVQIPTEYICGVKFGSQQCSNPPTDLPDALLLSVHGPGTDGPEWSVGVGVSPHLLTTCDSIFGPPPAACQAVVTHSDGAPVTFANPAKVGETISVYSVGYREDSRVGTTTTGYPATQGNRFSRSQGTLVFNYALNTDPAVIGSYLPVAGSSLLPEYFGEVAGYFGLYQANIIVPPIPAEATSCPDRRTPNAYLNPKLPNQGNLIPLCVVP